MGRSRAKDREIAEACKAMEETLDHPHRISDIAPNCGMTEHYFPRRFAAATDEAVDGYLPSRRMEHAAKELASTQRRIIVTDAAAGLFFRCAYGSSPPNSALAVASADPSPVSATATMAFLSGA